VTRTRSAALLPMRTCASQVAVRLDSSQVLRDSHLSTIVTERASGAFTASRVLVARWAGRVRNGSCHRSRHNQDLSTSRPSQFEATDSHSVYVRCRPCARLYDACYEQGIKPEHEPQRASLRSP
jgi:hypothetical protein